MMKFKKEFTVISIEPYITDKIDPRMYQMKRSLNFTCEIMFNPHDACEIKKDLHVKSFFTNLIPQTNLAHCFELQSKILLESEHVTFTNKELYQLLDSHFSACKELMLGVKLKMPNPEFYAVGLHVDYGSHIYHFVEDHKNNLDKWLEGTPCESLISEVLTEEE